MMLYVILFIVASFVFISPVWSDSRPLIRQTANVFVPTVQSLVLINTDTDQPIQTLQNNAVVNSVSQLSIEAIIDSSTSVGSIRFAYNGNTTFRVESNPPYCLCGDMGVGRYISCPELGVGKHTITATPFSQQNAMGNQGPSLQVTFEIVKTNIALPKIQSLVLINADTNQPIQTLQNNVVINAVSQLSIEAMIDSSTSVGSVQFGYKGNTTFRTESRPPYSLCGDMGAVFYTPCPELGIGQHTITATPFSGPNALGLKGSSIQIKFEIARSCITPRFLSSDWESFSPPYPLGIREGQGLMIGNDLVVFGGFINDFTDVTNHTYALDVTVPGSLWRRMDDLPLPVGITHAATALVGTKAYVCGGYSVYPAQHIPYCFVYDHSRAPGRPGRRQWTRMARLPNGGSAGGGMIYDSSQNSLYYSGGRRSFYTNSEVTNDSANTWKYSFQQLAWVASTPFPYKANHLSSVTHIDYTMGGKERHFFLGGQKLLNESGGNLAFLYEFIPADESWVKLASMPMARGHFTASTRSVGCGFLIAGGSVNSSTRYKNRTKDISFYDAFRNRWTYLGNLPVAEPTPIVTMHNGYLHFVDNSDGCKRLSMEWT